MSLWSTSSKFRKLELKQVNFCPQKSIARHIPKLYYQKVEKTVANLELNTYLCWGKTCEEAVCSGEHYAVVCAEENNRQRYQQQGQEKTGMSQQSLSNNFSMFWVTSLANTFNLKGQQWKTWFFLVVTVVLNILKLKVSRYTVLFLLLCGGDQRLLL